MNEKIKYLNTTLKIKQKIKVQIDKLHQKTNITINNMTAKLQGKTDIIYLT